MSVKKEMVPEIRERRVDGISGYLPLVVEIVGIPLLVWRMALFFDDGPILAGVLGILNALRMRRLPDPKPSAAGEGMMLG